MVVLILCNTIVMGMEFYGTKSTVGFGDALQVANQVFTVLFLLEMLLKLVGYGSWARWRWDLSDRQRKDAQPQVEHRPNNT